MKKPIKILFDANCLTSPNLTGVGRSTKGLIESLAKEFPDDILLVGHYFNFFSKNTPLNLPSAPNIKYKITTFPHKKVFNMMRRLGIYLPFEFLIRDRGDFIIFPDFLGWPSLFKTPSANFIHDTTYLDHPEFVDKVNLFDLKKLMPKNINRASFIITNSIVSKKCIQKHFKISDNKLLVEHLPLVDVKKINTHQAETRIAKLGIKTKYIFYIGTVEPRKNLVALLKAYNLLPPQLKNEYALVISGGKGWNDTEIQDKINSSKNMGDNIILTGYVDNEDKAALFMTASLFVMPSHYEGFGMQLIEAMFYNTPLLISDIDVFREVAGDSAFYSKTNHEDITKNLEILLSDDSKRSSKMKNYPDILSRYDWKIVAREIFAKISEVIK